MSRRAEGSPVDSPIRVWVAGCGTGEEVYSIAIYLMERAAEWGAPVELGIFGTDPDRSATEKARAGLYRAETVARDVSAERLARFFERSGGFYRVLPDLRKMCIFARHDLLEDPPLSRMDLVSCGDLLWLRERAARETALANLHYAVRPSGILMIEPSAADLSFTQMFVPRDAQRGLYSANLDFPLRLVLFKAAAPGAVKRGRRSAKPR